MRWDGQEPPRKSTMSPKGGIELMMLRISAVMLTLALLDTISLAELPFQDGANSAGHDRAKPRIVITTDPELDDSNSLVRFLLYSTDFDIEGLVYAGSGFHWKGDGKGTKWYVPGQTIHLILEATDSGTSPLTRISALSLLWCANLSDQRFSGGILCPLQGLGLRNPPGSQIIRDWDPCGSPS